jgi:hypothetical protein
MDRAGGKRSFFLEGRDRVLQVLRLPLTPKGGNPLYSSLRRRPIQAMWPGTAIMQTSEALSTIAGEPLANRARADAYGCTDGLRRLPALRLPHNPLSTTRC